MDRPRKKLLAHAGLPQQQARGVCSRDARRLVFGFPQRRARATDLLESGKPGDIGFECLCHPAAASGIQRSLNQEEKVIRVHGLAEKIGRPGLHGLHRQIHRSVGGEDDDGDEWPLALTGLE